MWGHLPMEVRQKILAYLKLHSLRYLKTVNKSMANDCRCVIRSEDWQDMEWNNWQLEEDVNGSMRQISFPFTVCILKDWFKPPSYFSDNIVRKSANTLLFATIHSIDVLCTISTTSGIEKISVKKAMKLNPNDVEQIQIVDLCIEVHGYGIVSSEPCLRLLLQEIVCERGYRRHPMEKRFAVARPLLSGLIFENVMEEDTVNGGQFVRRSMDDRSRNNAMTALELLDSMEVVTDIGNDKWVINDHHACIDESGLTVLDMMKVRSGPFA